MILYHDLNIDKISDEELNRLINIFNRDGIIMLYELKKSDLLAQNPEFHYVLEDLEKQKEKVLNKMKG